MRLTADLIAKQPQFINPLKERELDLRGQRIPAIENLSATQDQFDAIDLSNNDLKKLESATILKRLKMLLMSNNKLNRIAEAIGDFFPKLEALVLSNNDFAKLSELDNLASLRALRTLSLIDNAVTKLPDYRAYVLHLLPGLRTLDFQKVKQKEVDAAIARFGAVAAAGTQGAGAAAGGRGPTAGAEEEGAAAGAKRPRAEGAEAGDGVQRVAPPPPKAPKAAEPALPPELVALAREALANAESLEEVQRLEKALKSRNADTLRAVLGRGEAPAADGQS